jgi:RNA recognition motif-containing protein
MDNRKLFVGGISWNLTEEQLKEAFSKIGEVEEAKIITDRVSGRSKGFGFVTMKTVEDAKKANEEMNVVDLMEEYYEMRPDPERKILINLEI